MPYTLGQAAKATGMTKTAIAESIKKGRISAIKDDSGRYQIDPAELHRVYKLVSNDGDNKDSQNEHYKTQELTAKIMMLEIQVKSVCELKSRIETECDDLRRRLDEEASERRAAQTKLTALLTNQSQSANQNQLWQLSTVPLWLWVVLIATVAVASSYALLLRFGRV
jgi:hypothetical protein